MKEAVNTISFPDVIEFESATHFSKELQNMNLEDEIVFDLTETTRIHSSFIGFLMHTKYMLEGNGKRLVLRTSPQIDRLFSMLNLTEFFSGSIRREGKQSKMIQ
jgi:anti-anti-sigma regulatory factor